MRRCAGNITRRMACVGLVGAGVDVAWAAAAGQGRGRTGAAGPSDAKLLELLTEAGVHRAVTHAATVYEGQLRQGLVPTKAAAANQRLHQVAMDALSAPRLLFSIVGELKARLRSTDVDAVLAWYRSSLGRKVVDGEVAGQGLLADEKRLLALGDDQARKQRRLRLEAIEGMASRSEWAQAMADMAVAIAGAGLSKGNAAGDVPAGVLAFMRKTVEDRRPATLRYFQSLVRAQALVNQSGLSDAELKEYVGFVESDLGRRFARSVVAGTQNALLVAFDRMLAASQGR